MDGKREQHGSDRTYKQERSRPIPFFLAAVSVCDIQAFTENRFAKKGADRKPRDTQKGSHIRGILMLNMHQKMKKKSNTKTQSVHRSRKPGEDTHSWVMLRSAGHSTQISRL